MTVSALYKNGTWEATRIFPQWVQAGYGQGSALPIVSTGVIQLPAGTIPLNAPMQLTSGQVLRGHPDGTTLVVSQSLWECQGAGTYGKYPTLGYGYSWGDGWLKAIGTLANPVTQIGIENLTLKFPEGTTYEGHWKERGYNGIYWQYVKDAWITNVTILDCDNGVILDPEGLSPCGITVQNLTIRQSTRKPYLDPNMGAVTGHYGISVLGDNSLVQTPIIEGVFFHNANPAGGYGVWVHGKGTSVNFDYHHYGAHHILWDDWDIGTPQTNYYPWISGGKYTNGTNCGPYNTFWNVRKSNGSRVSTLPTGTSWPYDWFKKADGTFDPKLLTVVGHTQTVNDGQTWCEALSVVDPPSLYEALRSGWTPPLPPSGKFVIGQRVKSINTLTIRSGPAKSASQIGTQPLGIFGIVKEGPVKDAVSGFTYWRVDFDSGMDGWVGEDRLVAA